VNDTPMGCGNNSPTFVRGFHLLAMSGLVSENTFIFGRGPFFYVQAKVVVPN